MSKGSSPKVKVAAAFLTVALAVGCSSSVSAKLTLSRMIWDFESLQQGDTKTQKIILTNPDDESITIEKTELPEGCSVTPALENREIKPKEELEVELTLDSEGILGKIQYYAYFLLADSTIVPLTIKGEVFAKAEPRLRVTPPVWDFQTIKVGETRQYTFRCENIGTGDLKMEKVRVYDSRIRVVRNLAKETLAQGEKTDFALSVTGQSPGKCETDFYIQSNSAGSGFTKVSVNGYIVSKTTGVVVSSDLSSITNNTPFQAEITRTDKEGKEETLTVVRDTTRSFPRKPDTPRPHPADYTLTIKLLTTPPPVPKPAVEKPTPLTPKPEPKPAEGTVPPPEGPSEKAEETEKPEPTPEEGKGPEDETRPEEQPPPVKPEETKPSETPEQKEEKKPEKPEEEKEPAPAPAPEKPTPEKTAGESKPESEETKSLEKPTPVPPTEPAKPSDSEQPTKKPSGEESSPSK